MTDIIRYENLTFPEVEALPRNIPIVIPLGEIPDADLIKRVQRQSRSASASSGAIFTTRSPLHTGTFGFCPAVSPPT